jgi:hypothetical protein
MPTLSSAWKAITGRRTRKYNKLSDIDQSISKLDPDDISKQILKDPDLTPRRGRKLNVLLKIREEAKKQGKKGRDLKKELDSLARRQMEERRIEDAAVDRMMGRVYDELELEERDRLDRILPKVPTAAIIRSNKSNSKSFAKSRSAGGKRKTYKKLRN